MQACIYQEYGPADVVRLAEVEEPVARRGELLVRVHAAAVTTADWRFRASVFPPVWWLPARLMVGLLRPRNPILGMDFSGVVEAAGSDVSRFRVGDCIFGSTSALRRGAHAQYLVVSESAAVLHKPASLSHEAAAAVPFGANTALAFLRDFARVQPGQRILIVGASGSVGSWAVQLGRHLGAEVTGVCSARNTELVRSLGAHHVMDYNTDAFTPSGAAYDLIFDTVGVTTFGGCKRALAPRGVYMPLNGGLREIAQAALTAVSTGRKIKIAVSDNTQDSLTTIVGLIEAGVLRSVVDHVYPLSQIAEAHRHVEARHKRGSVIIRMQAA